MASMCSKEKSESSFPNTLQGFGYEFKDGKMTNIKTGEGFQFVVREGEQSYNQKHYEAIGEVVTEEVYKLLETDCELQRLPVPCDAAEKESQTFIFASEDALTNPEKLLILIHGSGVVRAGQWARRLIINDCLDSGTQIPFINKAKTDGYGVLVMNTNDNFRDKRSRIRGSENPESHALYVWDNYINPAKAKHIAIVAHSYGGIVTTALFQNKREDFIKRVFAVAMTDSVHFLMNPALFKDLIKISCNWVCSQQPLDTPCTTSNLDIKKVSAGVIVHEQTSWSSFNSVFRFISKRLAVAMGKATEEVDDEGAEGDLEDEGGTKGATSTKGATPTGNEGYGGHNMSDDESSIEQEKNETKKMKMDE